MKYSIELLESQNVHLPAGKCNVFKGATPEGFQCLVFVRLIWAPEGCPEEDFAGLENFDYLPGLPQSEIERLAWIAFPDGKRVEPPSAGGGPLEVKVIHEVIDPTGAE